MKIKLNYAVRAAGVAAALFTCAAGFSGAATAADYPPPEALVEQTSEMLLDEFTRRRSELEADKRELFALVDRVIAPSIDFQSVARLVLAKHWRAADEAQREEFVREFKKLLISTYATGLFRYTGDEKMTVTEVEVKERKGRMFADVGAEVSLPSGAPIAIDYKLRLGDDGRWYIYNLVLNGFDMVINYRGIYAAALDELGMDGMLTTMRETNEKNWAK